MSTMSNLSGIKFDYMERGIITLYSVFIHSIWTIGHSYYYIYYKVLALEICI